MNEMALGPAEGARVQAMQQRALSKALGRLGWEVDSIDVRIGSAGRTAEARFKRGDGRWIRVYVDALGRGSIERFQRVRGLVVPPNTGARQPLAPVVEDRFMGRQRFQGVERLLAGACAYLEDNGLRPGEALGAEALGEALGLHG